MILYGIACVLSLLLASSPTPISTQDINQTHPSDNVIRVNVASVNVGITVTGSHGDFIKGLRREDFRVFDNGVEHPITGFLSIDEPAQVVLMMECGPAAFFLRQSEGQAADMR